MVGGIGALLANGNLIKKVYFPREILTASGDGVVGGLQFAVEDSVVLAVALLLVGNFTLPWLPGVVLVLTIQTMFVYGLALGLGALDVYFHDVQHFIGIGLQLWFYASPVIYDLSFVPRQAEVFGYIIPFRTLYGLNPMVRFIEAYRDLLYELRFPPVADLAYMTGAAVLTLAVGRAIFNKFEPRLAEEL